MRLPNGYGSITQLKGNRRKKYMVRLTTGWELDESHKKVKQVQKVLGYYRTRQEAIKALADYNDDPFDLDALTVTFDTLWQRVYSSEIPEASLNNYRNAYKYLAPIKDMAIRAIKVDHMQACIDNCQTTQQGIIKAICHKTYNYALRHEITTKNPSQYLKSVTPDAQIERKVFTHEQVAELWTLTDYWWAKMTLMLLYSGCRTKELRTIDLSGLDMTNGWINLSAAKNDCSVRRIPIHTNVLPLFSDYIEAGGNLYGWSHAYLNKHLNAFHGHSAHDTRHSFSTRLRELGVDHLTIKRLLGHTPDDITERVYTHISDDELRAAIDVLEY